MAGFRSAALTTLVFVGVTSVAAAQTAGDSAAALALSADSTLAREIALGDSTRALLAQDDSQTQVEAADAGQEGVGDGASRRHLPLSARPLPRTTPRAPHRPWMRSIASCKPRTAGGGGPESP